MHDDNRREPDAPAALSRRAFLGGMVAAAATTRLAAAEAPARKIRLGVVGCGGRGSWIAGLFREHGGYEMHAVADYFPEVANRAGDALGVDAARRFSGLSGYQRLIESGVEAVALETPPYFFPEHARAAADAGLHVYMAKPVASDVPGCLAIEAAAAKATAGKRCFLVDYQMPTDPCNLEVMKGIRAGKIGKVLLLNSHYYGGAWADPAPGATIEGRLRGLMWVNDTALGGGYHGNGCIHAIDAALWVAGQRPIAAMGVSRIGRANPHGDSHDLYSLTYEFADGLAIHHLGKHINDRCKAEDFSACLVHGENGYAELGYSGKATLVSGEDAYREAVVDLYAAGARRNIATFHRCISEGAFANDTVPRAIDSALTTILGREAGVRRTRLTMEQLLKENRRLEVDLKGLKV